MIKKNDLRVIVIFMGIILTLIFFLVGFDYLFGSKTDWLVQHIVFPDYFRKLFYETGNLFPSFAFNVGGGQNIYYLSYYGLLSPYILLSYLLPFIKMVDYLIWVNIIIVILSGFLFYKWLRNNKFEDKVAIVSSFIFILIAPLLFQAHRQLMLMDYMPFLLLGLIGVDKYFDSNKKGLYIFSVFLMVMTSYFFSVGGLLALTIYGVYKFIKKEKKFTTKQFLFLGLKFLIPMVIGILMSFILLVPSIFAVLSRNTGHITHTNLLSLLIPHLDIKALLYSPYGMGFSCIALIAIIYNLLTAKREKLFLNITLAAIINVPLFIYLLNGMLYIKSKALIPFAPLISLVVATFLSDIKNKKIDKKLIFIILVISLLLFSSLGFKYYFYYIDLLFMVIALLLYSFKNKIEIVYIFAMIVALVSNVVVNKTETYVDRKSYNEQFGEIKQTLINGVIKNDKSFYRFNNLSGDSFTTTNKVYDTNYYQTSIYSSTYNDSYHNFYNSINPISYRNDLINGENNDIMFQTLMGVKYILSDNNIPIGYSLIKGSGSVGIYRNDNVFPLGYASENLMSNDDFSKLEYPYDAEALLNNIVVNKKVNNDFISSIKLASLEYKAKVDKSISIKEDGDKLIINTTKASDIDLALKEPIKNKILFVSFDMLTANDCKAGDTIIRINNVSNKLTCKEWTYFNNNYHFKYAISSPNDINNININLSKGHFEIENVDVFTLDYDRVENIPKEIAPFIVDMNKTKGDKIEGHIKVTQDGYFATTIPYDKGFTIMVNGQKKVYEEVNNAFIGFPLKKGDYEISMNYKAPGHNIGLLGSCVGFITFSVIIILEKRKKEIK